MHLHGFDLVRRAATPPVVRIDGRVAATGTLPGQQLHGRELTAGDGDHRARLALRPSFPDVRSLPDQHERTGRWRVYAAEVPALTGGSDGSYTRATGAAR